MHVRFRLAPRGDDLCGRLRSSGQATRVTMLPIADLRIHAARIADVQWPKVTDRVTRSVVQQSRGASAGQTCDPD